MSAAVVLAAAAGAGWFLMARQGPAEDGAGAAITDAEIGGPFTLVDHTGREVTDADFHGTFTLVYFGYTFCPDICPTSLWNLAQALELLGEAGEQVTPIFVTVDPERDTVEAMAGYVRLFHPRLIGLTGTAEQVADAAAGYRAYYARVENEGVGEYLVDHSSFIYLMDPEGRNVTLFAYGTPPDRMAEDIRRVLPADPAADGEGIG